MKRLSVVLFVLVLLVAACDATGSSTSVGPDTTHGSDTTGPDTTGPDTTGPLTTTIPDNGGDTTPWWILIILAVGLLIVIIALASRGSKKVVVTTPPTTWKQSARTGYAEARWLYDAMGEDMAVWRGNAKFEGATAVDASAGTNKAETWRDLQTRFQSASDALYALEAAAPDTKSAEAARSTITSMRATRDAVDARAEARLAYRTAEAAAADQPALLEARDREVRASRNLTEARNTFARSLTDLSTLV